VGRGERFGDLRVGERFGDLRAGERFGDLRFGVLAGERLFAPGERGIFLFFVVFF